MRQSYFIKPLSVDVMLDILSQCGFPHPKRVSYLASQTDGASRIAARKLLRMFTRERIAAYRQGKGRWAKHVLIVTLAYRNEIVKGFNVSPD